MKELERSVPALEFWAVLLLVLGACTDRPLVSPASRTIALDQVAGCTAGDVTI